MKLYIKQKVFPLGTSIMYSTKCSSLYLLFRDGYSPWGPKFMYSI